MAISLCELKWLHRLLQDFHFPIPRSILLHYNQAVIHISANPIFHKLTKHIEIDCHFVRDAFQSSFITPQHIHSATQPANIFSKALQPASFHLLRCKLDICDLHATILGGVSVYFRDFVYLRYLIVIDYYCVSFCAYLVVVCSFSLARHPSCI